MKLANKLAVKPNAKVDLRQWRADDSPGCKDKVHAVKELSAHLDELCRLQYRLYAENRRAVLVVLQGLDAAGKDGAIRHVFGGLNPQGCRVTAFKTPTAQELEQDFLWRIHQAVPPRGVIGIFNRSHYEDVLIARVRNLVPEPVWRARYGQINAFEEHLAANGVVLLKCFLHVSREEQSRRLVERLDDPERNWKFSTGDIEERRYWAAYQQAYAEALGRCSTKTAPWHIIPSDRKWYRNWAISRLLLETLRGMDLQFPPPLADVRALRRRLLAVGRKGRGKAGG
jgi:PPK2 family polyphosphate:nucleotide phosphotransferase